MNCQKCGSANVVEKSGTSKKNGRPWAGIKCNDCYEMTFINKKEQAQVEQNHQKYFGKPVPTEPVSQPIQPGQCDKKIESMVMAYAKDIVVAELNNSIQIENPFSRVIEGYKTLITAISSDYGK